MAGRAGIHLYSPPTIALSLPLEVKIRMTRRELLTGGSMLAASGLWAKAQTEAPHYDRSIIIDASVNLTIPASVATPTTSSCLS